MSGLSRKTARWLRNPSLQFTVSLILLPIVAIAREAFGGKPGLLAGGTFVCAALAGLGTRSYRHERYRFTEKPLLAFEHLMLRYLVGVAFLSACLACVAVLLAYLLIRAL